MLHTMTPAISNFAVDVVDRFAEAPGKVALQWRKPGGVATDVTFLDLKIRSEKVAYVLHRHGVRKGDRVCILLPPGIPWWESVLGCMRAGAVAVAGQDASTAQILKDQITRSRATLVIAAEGLADMIDRIREDCAGVAHWLSVGWEREGWVDYDRRVSLAPAGYRPADTSGTDPCIAVYDQGASGDETMYCHGDQGFDLEQLDAWRGGMAIVVRESNERS